MGLLDSILGGGNDASGGQSSLLGNKKVLLAVGVLAYLAMKHGKTPDAGTGAQPQQEQDGGLFGSLGSLLGTAGGAGALGSLLGAAGGAGGLGGLLGSLLGGGGNADQAAAGGLGPLQQILEQAGLGEQVKSWIGTGQNLPVSGEQITQALSGTGALEEVSKLASSFGINESDLANQLAEGLPEAVNHLTPQGSLPAA